MSNGITVRILGDFGPFSRLGKSIGYEIGVGTTRYLLDCGAPIFQHIGGHELLNINGLFVTHCHDDHKRWFTDLVLFNMYVPDSSKRISLMTSEDVYEELVRGSGPALDRSLSDDSKKIIDVPFEDYINFQIIGPRAKYKIKSRIEGACKTSLYIADRSGNEVGPDRAKIVISEKTNRPRMLFKDPVYGEWVEPESFYSFSSNVFYEENRNIIMSREGVTFEALKSPVWHGISAVGLRIKTKHETLIFSSDTANDIVLWKKLYSEKREQRLNMTQKEYEEASVICGDINDYIERTWSEERYKDAIDAYTGGVVIHDISYCNSVVHTDYERLEHTALKKDSTILTHSPDSITSEWILGDIDKIFHIRGNDIFQVVGTHLYPMNSDIYHKEKGKYYVGYKNDRGKYAVYQKNDLLNLSKEGEDKGSILYRVDLYEEISGDYYPILDGSSSVYKQRKDGRIETVEYIDDGSRGTVVKGHRKRLSGYAGEIDEESFFGAYLNSPGE
jgi:ribonuclease BN (tRNA processing enzyme)